MKSHRFKRIAGMFDDSQIYVKRRALEIEFRLIKIGRIIKFSVETIDENLTGKIERNP